MPRKKEQAVYQITVTERQLKLINAALEEFFRLGLNPVSYTHLTLPTIA